MLKQAKCLGRRRSAVRPVILLLAAFLITTISSIALGSPVTAYWDDRANGDAIGCDAFWPNNDRWNQDVRWGPDPCGGNFDVILEPSNWSSDPLGTMLDHYPNNGNGGADYDVVIDGGPRVQLLVGVAIESLTLTSAGGLDIRHSLSGNGALQIENGLLMNDGTIDLLGASPGGTVFLSMNGNVSLEGSGTVRFANGGANIINSVNPTDVLTIGVHQTITTAADSNLGGSELWTAFRNLGIVEAHTGALLLSGNDKQNDATLRAVNGGKMRLDGILVDNQIGTITAEGSSSVELSNATIRGGRLNGTGEIKSIAGISTLDGMSATILIEPDVSVIAHINNTLQLTGGINNTGTLRVFDVAGSGSTNLQVVGNVSVTGSGKIEFSDAANNYITADGPSDVLTIGPSQTVTTDPQTLLGSEFQARFVNEGIVEANVGALELNGFEKQNNGIIQATGGGTLRVTGTAIDNHAGTIKVATLSQVEMVDATIRGGTLNGAGEFSMVGGTSTLDGTTGAVTIEGTSVTAYRNTVMQLQGQIVNNGTIRVFDNGSGIAQLNVGGATTVSGNGRLEFEGGWSLSPSFVNPVNPGDTLTIAGGQTFFVEDLIRLRLAMANHAVVDIEGRMELVDDGALSNASQGIIRGAGSIALNGLALNNDGRVEPGASVGTLNLENGTYHQSGLGTLAIELGGSLSGQYDVLDIVGSAQLDGALDVELVGMFVPAVGDTFQILTANQGRAGQFATESMPSLNPGLVWNVLYGSNNVTLEVLVGLSGDFDENGFFECDDIDALTAAVAAGGDLGVFDLDGDGSLTLADVDVWLAQAGEENLGPGYAYLPADANLDGGVDLADLHIWNEHKFTAELGWCAGNFNADLGVSGADFDIWREHRFQSSGPVLVPEPATTTLIFPMVVILWFVVQGHRN